MTVAVAVVLAAGLAVVWVRVVHTLTAPSNAPKAFGQPGALVWDGRVFTSPSQLKAYLGPKSYARWSTRHPTAFGAPAPAARHTTASLTKTKTKAKAKPKPATHRVASPPVVETTSKSSSLSKIVLMALLLMGGLALGASAVVPARVAPIAVQRLYAEDPDRRMVAFAAATAILLGFGVSFYLS